MKKWMMIYLFNAGHLSVVLFRPIEMIVTLPDVFTHKIYCIGTNNLRNVRLMAVNGENKLLRPLIYVYRVSTLIIEIKTNKHTDTMKDFKQVNIDRIDNATLNQFKDYLIGTTKINGKDAEIILTDMNSGKENDPWFKVQFRFSGGKLNDIFSFTDPFKIIEEGADLDDFYYFTRSESEEEMNAVMSIIENAIK